MFLHQILQATCSEDFLSKICEISEPALAWDHIYFDFAPQARAHPITKNREFRSWYLHKMPANIVSKLDEFDIMSLELQWSKIGQKWIQWHHFDLNTWKTLTCLKTTWVSQIHIWTLVSLYLFVIMLIKDRGYRYRP